MAEMETESSPNASLDEVHDIADLLVSLRELLTNAFDDLIDEETSSVSSNDSRDSGTHSGEKIATNPVSWPNWTAAGIPGYASTPIGHRIPPPPGGIPFTGFGQSYPLHPGYFPPFNFPGYIPASVSPPAGIQHYQQVKVPLHEREETEGGNESSEHSMNDNDAAPMTNHNQMTVNYDPSQYPISDRDMDAYSMTSDVIQNNNNNNHHGNEEKDIVEYNPISANYRNILPSAKSEKTYEVSQYPLSDDSECAPSARIQLTNHRDFHKPDDDYMSGREGSDNNHPGGEFQNYNGRDGSDIPPGGDYQNYQVKYSGNGVVLSEDNNQGMSDPRFIQQGGSTDNREKAQLQILYDARGRQLEEIQHNLNDVKETTAREIRVLKHQLAMSEGELALCSVMIIKHSLNDVKETTAREIRVLKHQLAMSEGEKMGATGSLEESGRLVQTLKQENADLHSTVSSLQSQIADVFESKDQVLRKLQAAETTTENLNQQLFEVRSSESLTRARELHESVLSSMKQKHEQELFNAREKIDQVQGQLEDKVDEVGQLRQQLTESMQHSDRAQIDRADTINRLTRSLEDSQRQCRDLLESGASSELGNLRVQLNQAIASKCISEDLCKTLQTDLCDLKEQMSYFEAASQLGVLSGSASSRDHLDVSPSESFSQLNIRSKSGAPMAWKTPKPHITGDDTSMMPDEIVPKLKSEMQKILLSNKAKREQVTQLQSELKASKEKMNEWKRQSEETEKKNSKLEESIQRLKADIDSITPDSTGMSGREKMVKRQLENLQQEKESLSQELEEIQNTLAEVGSSEERVTEINAELRQQMSQMVTDYDEDKRIALEKCQEACLNHHEKVKEDLRKDLEQKHEADCADLKADLENRLRQLQAELTSTLQELDSVKEMYVTACREKDELEDVCKTKFEKEMENKLTEMKEALEKVKEEEIKQLHSLESTNMTEVKDKWCKSQETQVQRLVDTKVAAEKLSWFEEQKAAKQAAIKKAVESAERELKMQYDSRLDQEVQDHIAKAKSEWLAEKRLTFENELHQRLSREKEKWQETSDQGRECAIKEAVSQARTEWVSLVEKDKMKITKDVISELEEKHRVELENELKGAVEEAQKKWDAEKKNFIEKAIEETSATFNKRISKLTEDLDTIKKENELITKELETDCKSWHQEKDVLNREMQDSKEKLKDREGSLEKVKQRSKQLHEEMESLKEELRLSQQSLTEKDNEWRDKMSAQQEANEEEYQRFLVEQRNNLNEALKRSREEFESEKVNIEKLHTDKIKSLTEKHEQKMSRELERVSREWGLKVDKLQTLVDQHSASSPASDTWQSEKLKLVSEIEERDALLNTADSHLEEEINKLRQDMENAHQQHLQEELSKLRRQSLSPEEKQKYLNELSDAQTHLKHLENTYEHQIEALQDKLQQRESLISEQQARFEGRLQSVNKDSAVKISDFEQEVEILNTQLQKSESRRQELKELLGKTEGDQEQIVSRYKLKNDELNTKLRNFEISYDKSQAEHDIAMETMKNKMVLLRKEHDAITEGLKREHIKERLLLEKRALLASIKDVCEKEAQTDRSEVQVEVTEKIKAQYSQTIKKIKSEVMKHVNETNTRAAQTVKSQVAKARHETTKQLRKYYLQCLNDILTDVNCKDKEAQMSRMEHVLHQATESRRGSSTSSAINVLHEDYVQNLFDEPVTNNVGTAPGFTAARKENDNPLIKDKRDRTHPGSNTTNTASRLSEKLSSKKPTSTQVYKPTYKYTSLKDNVKSQPAGLSNIHINPSDAGLSRLPQQPRQFNPPPEKLSSVESSRSSSPVDVIGVSTLRTKPVQNKTKFYGEPNSRYDDSASRMPPPSVPKRQPMKALPNEDVQRMMGKIPVESKKPVAMATRQTQAPSPMTSKSMKH